MDIRKNLEKFNLTDYSKNVKKSYNWCNTNGGVWPKDEQFGHVVEETGELIDEIISNDYEKQVDELGDLNFTYLTFIDNEDIIISQKDKYRLLKYIVSRTKHLDDNLNLDQIIQLLISEVSKENKVQRKLSGRKENYKYSEKDVENSKILNLFLLHLLSTKYKLDVNQLIENSINKYEGRDLK